MKYGFILWGIILGFIVVFMGATYFMAKKDLEHRGYSSCHFDWIDYLTCDEKH